MSLADIDKSLDGYFEDIVSMTLVHIVGLLRSTVYTCDLQEIANFV
jgi:hypothetical protein